MPRLRFSKRWVLPLVLLALALTALLLAGEQSHRAVAQAVEPSSAQSPAERTLPPRTRPAGGPQLTGSGDNNLPGLTVRMLTSTLVVLALAGLVYVVVKKLLPKISTKAGKNIAVLETVYLGPRKTLHLLRVGNQRFLVAGSRDQLSLLGEVTSAFNETAPTDSPPGEAAPGAAGPYRSFAQLLERQKDADEDSPREPAP